MCKWHLQVATVTNKPCLVLMNSYRFFATPSLTNPVSFLRYLIFRTCWLLRFTTEWDDWWRVRPASVAVMPQPSLVYWNATTNLGRQFEERQAQAARTAGLEPRGWRWVIKCWIGLGDFTLYSIWIHCKWFFFDLWVDYIYILMHMSTYFQLFILNFLMNFMPLLYRDTLLVCTL